MTTVARPYRHSGLDWVTEIPRHWGTPPVGAAFQVQLGKMLNPEAVAGTELRPYLRNVNVQWDRIDLDDVAQMNFDGADRARYALRPGDLLVCEGGEVGRAALWHRELDDCYYQKALHRVRPYRNDSTRFLMYALMAAASQGVFENEGNTSTIVHLTAEKLRAHRFPWPPAPEQQAVVDYLDAEISAVDDLLSKKRMLVELLQEQIDAAIMELVRQSAVVQRDHPLGALPVRRQLARLDRAPEPDAQVITAFRDGQVTARALRRSEGFTESWTEGARVQGVLRGDVVVHGLDGFAGAIGTSEADGVCSPVYHVCSPIDGGDAHFYGGMLRLLATTGYLGNFATSTRERAVDFRNWDLFGRIPIPIVEVAEQRRIGDRIRRLAPIRERVARSQVLINERKHALITAAVTGQLHIPGAPPD